ncbi:MAG: hypothetical protein RIS64_1236 [Bacteroidota bacterium]|jgi:hypothetical protein
MIAELLQRITSALDHAEMLYMVSGSVAMVTYTVPRMTRDIDIIIELREQDIRRFCQLFQEGYYLDEWTVQEEVQRHGMFNIIDFKTGYKIDFMVKKNTLYRQTEFERRVRKTVLGCETWLVSIEDLIISKLIWIQELQSERQMTDIQNLLTHPDIDDIYLTGWIYELNLKTFDLL